MLLEHFVKKDMEVPSTWNKYDQQLKNNQDQKLFKQMISEYIQFLLENLTRWNCSKSSYKYVQTSPNQIDNKEIYKFAGLHHFNGNMFKLIATAKV